MPSSKYLIGIFMTSLGISYSFLFATILCVHPSLWIDIIMIFIYLESYTLLRSCISIWYPLLSRPPFLFLFYFFGGSVKVCVSSADLISFHLDALFCGEDHSLLLVLMRLCHFYWYPSSWQSYPFYIFTTGCHKHRLFIWLLVSMWTHLLFCVGMIGLALCISFIQEYIDA